jgi:hypothetical protein
MQSYRGVASSFALFTPYDRGVSHIHHSQEAPADLGVVFVHGIGSQTHGETLKAFSDVLIHGLTLGPEPAVEAGRR